MYKAINTRILPRIVRMMMVVKQQAMMIVKTSGRVVSFSWLSGTSVGNESLDLFVAIAVVKETIG